MLGKVSINEQKLEPLKLLSFKFNWPPLCHNYRSQQVPDLILIYVVILAKGLPFKTYLHKQKVMI